MSYIGLQPQQSLLSTFSQTFSGDGSTLQFTLSRAVSKASDLEVFVGNTQKLPTTEYTANGTQLLFVSAPAAGSNNITVIVRAGALSTINVTAQSFNQGSVVAPTVNSTVATTTGIYWPTTTDLGIAANGSLRLSVNSTAASTTTTSGAVVVSGGMGVSGNVNTGGNVVISANTASTNAGSGALVVAGGVGIGGAVFITDDLQVAGDFTVNGTFTTTASDSLAITDPFVFLASNNAGDALDQGFVGKYVDGGSVTRYHGIFRDVTDGGYKVFANLTNQPTTVVDTANASFNYANLTASRFISTIATGTAPFTVNSTTAVANLSVGGTAGTVTTGAQPNITSVGTLTALNVNAQVNATIFSSNVATGTAPFIVQSTTQVDNLTVATAGTVTTAAQPNITSVGNLTIANIDNIQIDVNTISSTNTNGNIQLSPNGTGLVVVTKSLVPNANVTLDIGSTSLRFSTLYGLSTSAQYADLAEKYTADANYDAGTVVSFGGTEEITLSSLDHDVKIAGVITTNPAHVMNDDLQATHVATVALVGRVPCKVTGAVAKGDMMVSAGNGRARSEINPKLGSVLGKALQDHPADGNGTIEIVVGRV